MENMNPHERIEQVVQPDERIERIDSFQMTSRADAIRAIVITMVVSVLLTIAALYVLPHVLSPEQLEMYQSMGTTVPLVLGSVWSLVIWTKQVPLVIACTDQRIIVSGLSRESWLMSLYSNEIEKVEAFDSRYGGRVARIFLSKGRKTFAYIEKIELHGIRDVGGLVNLIEAYRSKNLSRPEGQVDFNNNFSVKRNDSPRDLIIFGLIFLSIAVFKYHTTVQSQSWPKASAEVISASISERSDIYGYMRGDFKNKYFVDRQIRFSAGEKEQVLNLTDSDAPNFDSKSEAEAARDKKQIEIIYNPDKPETVILDTVQEFKVAALSTIIGLAFVFGGVEARSLFKNREGWTRTLGMYALVAVHFVLFCVIWALYNH